MKFSKFLAVLVLLTMALAACGGDEVASVDTTEAPTSTETTMSSGEFDLGGREVTVGVENAYLPFNYVLPGETEGQGLGLRHMGCHL